jgi:hypothetical protein
VEDVAAVVVSKPEQGAHCQASFAGEELTPWRHQGMEIPPIKPVGTE